jgi:hypothetical protein
MLWEIPSKDEEDADARHDDHGGLSGPWSGACRRTLYPVCNPQGTLHLGRAGTTNGPRAEECTLLWKQHRQRERETDPFYIRRGAQSCVLAVAAVAAAAALSSFVDGYTMQSDLLLRRSGLRTSFWGGPTTDASLSGAIIMAPVLDHLSRLSSENAGATGTSASATVLHRYPTLTPRNAILTTNRSSGV